MKRRDERPKIGRASRNAPRIEFPHYIIIQTCMSGSAILLGAFQHQELVWSNCILDERSGRCLGSQAWPQAPAPLPPSWSGLRERAPRWTHRRRRSAVGRGWTREGGGGEEGEGGEGQQAGGGEGAVALLSSPSSLPQPDARAAKNFESQNTRRVILVRWCHNCPSVSLL